MTGQDARDAQGEAEATATPAPTARPTSGGRGPRGPRRAGRDKGEILEAIAQIIAQRGADATRFADVAEATGTPISTLQYYFGSREDLLVAAFRHASETELVALRATLAEIADPWDRLVLIVDQALADYVAGRGQGGHLWIEAWRFGMRDDEMRDDVLRDYAVWRELISDAVRAGVDDGRFTASSDPEQTALLLVSLLDGLGMPLALDDPAVSVESARDASLNALSALLGRNAA